MRSTSALKLATPETRDADSTAIVDEDAALVARAQAGDREAFGQLFAKHHGRVRAMCTRMLSRRSEIDDAVQHAFLEAWRCLDRFEGRSRFSTWITRIAIHTCFGIRRKLARLFLTEDGHDDHARAPQWANPPMSPDEGAVHTHRKRAVDDILQKLSPKRRVVFVLAELEGMTAPEIAEILEIPDATVRTRLFHARKDFSTRARQHPGFADLYADDEGLL